MLRLIRKYHEIFDLHKAEGFKKILFGFMLTLPHILTCIILILFFPKQWIGIVIVGLILPDLSYFFYMFVHPAAIFKENYYLKEIGKHRKKIVHMLTFILILFLLISKQYILVLAGGIHLVLDLLGF